MIAINVKQKLDIKVTNLYADSFQAMKDHN
jgi:hypothetical protein